MNKRILWFGGLLGLTVFAHTAHLASYFFSDAGHVTPSLWLPNLTGWLMICTTAFYVFENILTFNKSAIRQIINNSLVETTVLFILFQHGIMLLDWDVLYSALSGVALAYYYWCYYNLTKYRLSE